jgi:hypothetical protein
LNYSQIRYKSVTFNNFSIDFTNDFIIYLLDIYTGRGYKYIYIYIYTLFDINDCLVSEWDSDKSIS